MRSEHYAVWTRPAKASRLHSVDSAEDHWQEIVRRAGVLFEDACKLTDSLVDLFEDLFDLAVEYGLSNNKIEFFSLLWRRYNSPPGR